MGDEGGGISGVLGWGFKSREVNSAISPDFPLRQCLFEEDQLAGFANENPVAIVESEKTAILMSALMPDYIWLSTGGLSNLNPAIFTALKRCKIQLFPDLGGFSTWQKKVDELKRPDLKYAFPTF